MTYVLTAVGWPRVRWAHWEEAIGLMTTEHDPDTEPTVEIERPSLPAPAAESEDVDQNFDPE